MIDYLIELETITSRCVWIKPIQILQGCKKNPCGLQSPPRPACGLEIISTASCATSATVVKSGNDSSNQSPRSTVDPHFAGEGSPSSHWQSLNMRTNTDYPIMRWGHTSFTNKNTYRSSYHSHGIWSNYANHTYSLAFPMFNSVGFFLLPSPLVRYPLPGTGCLESPCSTVALCPNSTDSTTTSSASAVCSRLPTSLSITSCVSTCRDGAWCVCAPTAVKPSITSFKPCRYINIRFYMCIEIRYRHTLHTQTLWC